MRVVCDAGPLIALSKLGQLGLLTKLYRDILIPSEVYREVVTRGLRLGAPDAQAVDFLVREGRIRVAEVTPPSPLPAWAQAIDVGEFAAITLAQRRAADWVLMDDARARRAARQAKLPVRGTIGVFVEAFRKKHVTRQEFEFLIENIRTQPALWISERLCDAALNEVRRQQA